MDGAHHIMSYNNPEHSCAHSPVYLQKKGLSYDSGPDSFYFPVFRLACTNYNFLGSGL